MSRPVVPIRSLSMRLPDVGRIRTGKKGPKGQPQKLDTFRFTSPDRTALDQIAQLYGGTVTPWKEPKASAGQFEVITGANEIRIALPPDALGESPVYEMWSGGGCQRRCDGETCEIAVADNDGFDLQQHPCLCLAKNVLECKVKTRLSVLLPEVRMTGVWRLDSGSWNVAQEMPAMVEAIRQLQDRGIVRGLLRLEQRTQVLAGRTNKFAVPVLGIDETVEALAAGHARLGAIGAGSSPPVPELGPGTSEGEDQPPAGTDGEVTTPDRAASPSAALDDEVVDAEIVEEPPMAQTGVPAAPSTTDDGTCSICGATVRDGKPITKGGAGQSKWVHVDHYGDAPHDAEKMTEPQSKRLHAALRTINVVGPARHAWATEHLGRPVVSFSELTKDEANRLIDLLERESTPA